jgi:hypothetical protein
MITSIWYDSEDKLPEKEGYYLGYKKPTLGDDEEGFGLYYWGTYYRQWRENISTHSPTIFISFWCEPPDIKYPMSQILMPTDAEIDAWKNVQDAISKYNMIKNLVQ